MASGPTEAFRSRFSSNGLRPNRSSPIKVLLWPQAQGLRSKRSFPNKVLLQLVAFGPMASGPTEAFRWRFFYKGTATIWSGLTFLMASGPWPLAQFSHNGPRPTASGPMASGPIFYSSTATIWSGLTFLMASGPMASGSIFFSFTATIWRILTLTRVIIGLTSGKSLLETTDLERLKHGISQAGRGAQAGPR